MNEDSITEIPINTKKSSNYKYWIKLIIGMFILFFVFQGTKFLGGLYFLDKSLENNYAENVDDTYNFLYYDNGVRPYARELYPALLKEKPFLIKALNDNNIKIFITNKEILKTFTNLCKVQNIKLPNNAIGVYVNSMNLIIIKDTDISGMEITLTDSILNNLNETKQELLKEKKTALASDIWSKEYLKSFEIRANGGTLYHECGHFMDNHSYKELSEDKEFKKVYELEKDILFKNDAYNKSNTSEYVAQCVSNYMLYGKIQSADENGKVEDGLSGIKFETANYIDQLVAEFKESY